ncbi:MAG: hypothetical protein WCW13_07190 [archaeon]
MNCKIFCFSIIALVILIFSTSVFAALCDGYSSADIVAPTFTEVSYFSGEFAGYSTGVDTYAFFDFSKRIMAYDADNRIFGLSGVNESILNRYFSPYTSFIALFLSSRFNDYGASFGSPAYRAISGRLLNPFIDWNSTTLRFFDSTGFSRLQGSINSKINFFIYLENSSDGSSTISLPSGGYLRGEDLNILNLTLPTDVFVIVSPNIKPKVNVTNGLERKAMVDQQGLIDVFASCRSDQRDYLFVDFNGAVKEVNITFSDSVLGNSCGILRSVITQSRGSLCGGSNYSSVADLDVDLDVDQNDLDLAQNYSDETICATQLTRERNFCTRSASDSNSAKRCLGEYDTALKEMFSTGLRQLTAYSLLKDIAASNQWLNSIVITKGLIGQAKTIALGLLTDVNILVCPPPVTDLSIVKTNLDKIEIQSTMGSN